MERRQEQVKAQSGGVPCIGSFYAVRPCSMNACPGTSTSRPCLWSSWSDWHACDRCGGQRNRTRRIKQTPGGGDMCPTEASVETGPCPRACSSKPLCTWTDWTDWGHCSMSCGKGRRSRRRSMALMNTDNLLQASEIGNFRMKMQGLEVQRSRELAVAFICGCLSFLVALKASTWVRTAGLPLPPDFVLQVGSSSRNINRFSDPAAQASHQASTDVQRFDLTAHDTDTD